MNRTVDTQNNVLIEDILCPELSSVEFSSGLQNAFTNINNNFAKLANHEFIKGDMGTSVEIKSISIYDENKIISEDICKKLAEYISELLSKSEQDRYITYDTIQLDYYDNFTPENAGSIQVLYNKTGDTINNELIPVSSLQYVFLDGRFWNNKVGKIDSSAFEGLTDLSCILVYDKDNGFKSLNNAFPTMYYENGVGLCWKLNGMSTGLPVQGIPGNDGKNSVMRIVKVENLTSTDKLDNCVGEVKYVFEDLSGYIPVDNADIDINNYDKSSAIIINNASGEIHVGSLSISKKEITNEETGEVSEIDVLIATCDPKTSLNNSITASGIKEAFKRINLTSSNTEPEVLQGLFIPINTYDNNAKKQAVHLISASAIINTDDTAKTNNDIIFTPVNDINNLNVDDNNKLLQVDKYLYVRINKDSNILRANTYDNKSIDNILSKYNYCIKYKLSHIATNVKDEWLKPDDEYTSSTCNFGYAYKDGSSNILLSSFNTMYTSAEEIFTDIDSKYVYIWEQCADSAIYDIDELTLTNTSYQDVPSQFKRICTRTFTPGISTDIYWFNALEIINDNTDYYEIPGWSVSNDIFDIIKFVPVYKDKDFHVNDDTAINFNYNVNITGCDHQGADSKRNLTVHGDINCDNINVYKLTATGEIDNIYTRNTIVSDNGLNIGLIEYDEYDVYDNINTYNFTVDKSGNVISKKNITANMASFESNIKSPNIDNTTETVSGSIYTNNINVTGKSGNKKISASVNNTVNNPNDLNININSVKEISISKENVLSDTIKYLPDNDNASIIKTSVPIMATEKSSIIVSNTENTIYDENIHAGLYDYLLNNYEDTATVDEKLRDKINSFETTKEYMEYSLDEENLINNISNKTVKNVATYNDYNYDIIYLCNTGERTYYAVDFPTREEYNKNDSLICRYILKGSEDISNFNNNSNIKISMPKMKFAIGLYSHCSNGYWTNISKDCYLKFKIVAKFYKDDTYQKEVDLTESNINNYTYKFADFGKTWNNQYAVHTQDGKKVTTKTPDTYNQWRYKAFEVNPYDVIIDDINVLSEIGDYYIKDSYVEILIYPVLHLHIGTDGNSKKCADDCAVLRFKCIGTSNPSAKIISTNTYLSAETGPLVDNYSKLEYSEIEPIGSNVKTTIICNDGVIIRNSNNIFGIGNINDKPSLIYTYKDETGALQRHSKSLLDLLK